MKARVAPTLQVFDTLLGKKTGGFMCGEHLTLADLQCYFEITDEIVLGRKDFAEFPLVDAWYKKVGAIKEVAEI